MFVPKQRDQIRDTICPSFSVEKMWPGDEEKG
jgi:hypothetical protein